MTGQLASYVSPAFRRACHQALDLVLDAWADEREEQTKPKRQRAPSMPKKLDVPPLSPERLRELEEQVDRQRQRAGYKTG